MTSGSLSRGAVKMVLMRPFLRTSLLAALATCAAISVTGQTAPPAPLRLVAANSTRNIPTVTSGDTELVAFDDLSALFGLTVREDTVARAITGHQQGQDDRPVAEPGARLDQRPPCVAAGAARQDWRALVRAGRVHRPRALAHL